MPRGRDHQGAATAILIERAGALLQETHGIATEALGADNETAVWVRTALETIQQD